LPPLKDRIRHGVRVLFVGINPGVRSAVTGHHFAGFSNRFWKLLYDARVVPERIGYQDDDRLPQWGLGITNVVPRATPGIDTLRADEYVAGVNALRRKVRRWKPEVVAFVGVTVFRAAFACRPGTAVRIGLQRERFEGARVVVLPNPSGRNAHLSYEEMVAAFRILRRFVC
jgi:double-stranded uracil-DNA glycosylase